MNPADIAALEAAADVLLREAASIQTAHYVAGRLPAWEDEDAFHATQRALGAYLQVRAVLRGAS